MPTYATWNPADKHADIVLSGGNLIATSSTNPGHQGVRSNIGISSGTWYIELKVSAGAGYVGGCHSVGIATATHTLSDQVGSDVGAGDDGWGFVDQHFINGPKLHDDVQTAYYGSIFTADAIIGMAINMDTGKIWWSYNGAWIASGDPVAGTNEAYSGLTGTLYVMSTVYFLNPGAFSVTGNFGASAFAHAVPAGFNSGIYTSAETYEVSAPSSFSLHDVIDGMNLSDTADAAFSLHDVMEAYTLTAVLASTAFSLHDFIDAEIGLYDDTANASFSLSDFIDATLGKESERYRNFLNYTGKHIGLKFQNAVAGSPLFLEDLKMWIARTRQEAGYTKINVAGKHIGLKFQNNTIDETFYLEDAVLKSFKSETR